jgi:hypothetical protein
MRLNDFNLFFFNLKSNLKNDLQQFKEHVKITDASNKGAGDETSSESDTDSESERRVPGDDEKKSHHSSSAVVSNNDERRKKPAVHLIHAYTDVYKSIKLDKYPTSLVINRPLAIEGSKISDEIAHSNPKLVESVTEMAGILVKSIIDKAMKEFDTATNSSTQIEDCYDPEYISRNYNYTNTPAAATDTLSSAANRKSRNGANESETYLNEFNLNKSNSRLSYYKEFGITDNNLLDADDHVEAGYRQKDQEFLLEFEDEPAEYINLFKHTPNTASQWRSKIEI